MGGEPTRPAKELRLRLPICFFTMPTDATGLAGIRRIDIDNQHTGQCRLVGNESAELEETPGVQHSPVAFRNRSLRADTFPDMRQIFQRNSARSALRRADNRLRKTMVDIFR